MKLSEAIRLGSMAIPPTHGPVFERRYSDNGRTVCAACAIGTPVFAVLGHAAADLVGVDSMRDVMAERWPFVLRVVASPVTGNMDGDVVNTMICLFESSHWTRERIADWVETIERAQEQPVAPVEVAVEIGR